MAASFIPKRLPPKIKRSHVKLLLEPDHLKRDPSTLEHGLDAYSDYGRAKSLLSGSGPTGLDQEKVEAFIALKRSLKPGHLFVYFGGATGGVPNICRVERSGPESVSYSHIYVSGRSSDSLVRPKPNDRGHFFFVPFLTDEIFPVKIDFRAVRAARR